MCAAQNWSNKEAILADGDPYKTVGNVMRAAIEREAAVAAVQTDFKFCDDLQAGAWNGDMEQVRRGLNQGEQVTATNEAGWTCLHFAAAAGNAEIMRELIGSGAAINGKDNNGW